jgi:hypothetical protein
MKIQRRTNIYPNEWKDWTPNLNFDYDRHVVGLMDRTTTLKLESGTQWDEFRVKPVKKIKKIVFEYRDFVGGWSEITTPIFTEIEDLLNKKPVGDEITLKNNSGSRSWRRVEKEIDLD